MMMFKEVLNNLFVSLSQDNSDFTMVILLIYGVLWSFTKLIDKKIEWSHISWREFNIH